MDRVLADCGYLIINSSQSCCECAACGSCKALVRENPNTITVSGNNKTSLLKFGIRVLKTNLGILSLIGIFLPLVQSFSKNSQNTLFATILSISLPETRFELKRNIDVLDVLIIMIIESISVVYFTRS